MWRGQRYRSRSAEFGHGLVSSRTHPEPLSVQKRYGGEFQVPAPVENPSGSLGPMTYREHVDMQDEIRRSRRQ